MRSNAAEPLLQYSPCSLDFMPWLPQTARRHESPRKVPTYTEVCMHSTWSFPLPADIIPGCRLMPAWQNSAKLCSKFEFFSFTGLKYIIKHVLNIPTVTWPSQTPFQKYYMSFSSNCKDQIYIYSSQQHECIRMSPSYLEQEKQTDGINMQREKFI